MTRARSSARGGASIGAVVLALAGAAVEPPPVAAAPDLLLSDGRRLLEVRERIRGGDVALGQALSELRRQADVALALGPWSVTQKSPLPPGADPHDYRSLAPYWWPDPGKPDGLPWIRRDGERNPASGDDASDSGHFRRLRSSVGTLCLAYFLTGDEPYARHAAHLLRVWFLEPATRMTPHLRYAQAIPGRNDGRSIGIIETARVPELLDRVALLSASRAWSDADARGLHEWMSAYLAWLLESEPGRQEGRHHNNHGSWYDVQVAALALKKGRPELARTQLSGPTRSRIAAHVEPDGRQPRELARTRALSYSVFNLEALASAAVLGDRVGVELWTYETQDGRSLRRALDYLLPYADPARKWPHPQITEPPWAAFGKVLRVFSERFGDARFAEAHARLPLAARHDPENVLLRPAFELRATDLPE